MLKSMLFVFCTVNLCGAALGQEIERRLAIWEATALTCKSNGVSFPSKQTGEPQQPCDDGDMTLFNGLLCAAGDERGCIGVAEAQDPISGLWHRSPRIRFLGKNDRGEADSSPDMALGIQLYLLKTKDIKRAEKWLLWIHNNNCLAIINDKCIAKGRGIPKFCSHDNCIIRPQDYAMLAVTVNFLQSTAGLGVLPGGSLRSALGTFSGNNEFETYLYRIAPFSSPGFPQHVDVGVPVLALRITGADSQHISEAALTLATRNPGNAFFSYLARRQDTQVTAETLARCTDAPASLLRPLFQWQWERSNDPDEYGRYAWQQSSMWDCIFMARLLGK